MEENDGFMNQGRRACNSRTKLYVPDCHVFIKPDKQGKPQGRQNT